MKDKDKLLHYLIDKALNSVSIPELINLVSDVAETSVCFKDIDGSIYVKSSVQEFIEHVGAYPLQELRRHYKVIKISDNDYLLGHLILPNEEIVENENITSAIVLALRVYCIRNKAERERKYMAESDILQRFLTRRLRFEKVQSEFKERPFPLEDNSMIIVLGLRMSTPGIASKEHETITLLDDKFSRFFKCYVSWRERRKIIIAITPQFPMDEKAATDFIIYTIENMKNNISDSNLFSDICAGFGTIKNDINNLPDSYDEADRAFRVACLSNDIWWRKWRELGALRLLMFFSDNKESDLFIESALSKLLPDIEEQDSQILLSTLRALDNNSWNLKQTSLFLNLHYNTMKYRFQKIQEILEVDFSCPETRFNVSLALRLLSLKGK
ncbi:MAG: helix-turn-helix domain-containing protein [Synergistota bacterium]|nr:helix-turn-helix domain-containing protein [Synergistota bacterium]